MVSVSASFAISDDDSLAIDDGLTVDNEINVDNGVLTAKEDSEPLEETPEDESLEANDANGDALKESNVVTPENWKEFIDNETKVIKYTGDELVFEGDFSSDLNISAINVINPIKLIGDNAIMNNISFYVMANDVSISGFKIINEKSDISAILVTEVSNVEISNVKLNFTAMDDYDGYAIWVGSVDNLKLLNNIINYVGTTVYAGEITNRRYAVLIENSTHAVVKENKFNISTTSCKVDWHEVPPGSWNYVRVAYSEGLVFDECDYLEFSDNEINLGYNNRSGSDDTIYVLDVKNSANVTVSGNDIDAVGADHVYGIIVDNVDNFTVSGNDVNISSDVFQAIGIDIEGPANGVVKDNNVSAYGDLVNTVYSGMNWKPATVTIENNNITAEGYAANALELGGTYALVNENTIVAKGNYTAGVIVTTAITFKDNVLTVSGSNVGEALPGDYYMSKEVVAIASSSAGAVILRNQISSTNIGIKSISGEMTLSNNNISVVANLDNVSNFGVIVDSTKFNMNENNVTYVGLNNGSIISNAMFVRGSDVTVEDNYFDLLVPSCHVDWPEVPPGSNNWLRTPYSEGLVFDECNNLKFNGNEIDLGFNSRIGSDDTIYVVDVKNSDNVIVSGNDIDAVGADHVYGIIVDNADNFTVSGNDVNISSDVFQAIGIDIEGPANGVVKDNNITAYGDLVNTVYSGMNWKPATVTIENNNITAEGYAANAIELGGTSATVEGNTIVANGNYTAGIISTVPDLTVKDNVIAVNGSNVGENETGDYYMKKDVLGIDVVSGVAEITANTISSNGNKTIDVGNTKSVISGNSLVANNTVGDKTISSTGNATISGNAVLKTVLSGGSDIDMIYGEVKPYSVKLTYENGTALANQTVTVTINNKVFKAVTGADGIASFSISGIIKGTFDIEAVFAGDDYNTSSVTKNTLVVKPIVTKLTYAASQTVLLTAVKKGSYYKVVLKDASGKALANKKIKITFNGKTTPLTTGSNGVVSFKLAATKVGTYKLTIKFDGDNYYAAATGSATIKINKEATKLAAKKKTFKAKVKTKKYTVTLKDSKGKAIKKVKLTLKVKGKKYTAKTNSKGKATFKIKKLNKKGTFKAKVNFAGNNLYKAVSKTVKIKVKK